MTFKQLEAIFWVARLGGFSAAASRLHTTQSAISKRIQELEDTFGTPLFDRTLRTARLTDKGEEMLQLATRLLAQRDAAVESFSRPEVMQRRLRLGVTELTAMTWLPRLVRQIQETYPKVIIEPDVDLSMSLRDKLLADEVDMIVVPDAFQDERFVATRAGSVASSWMCRPGLLVHTEPLQIQDLARQRVLVQGDRSGTGILYNKWMQSLGIDMPSTVVSNNMIALIGMAVAGLGISYLPRQCLQPLVDNGSLVALEVEPALPQVKYMTLHRSELHSPLISAITAMVEGCCDFSRMFQTGSLKLAGQPDPDSDPDFGPAMN